MRTHQMQANAWANDMRGMNVEIIDDVTVYSFTQHVMISREDFEKLQTRLMRTTTERNRNEAATGIYEKQECPRSGEQ